MVSHLIERIPIQRGVLLGIAPGLGFERDPVAGPGARDAGRPRLEVVIRLLLCARERARVLGPGHGSMLVQLVVGGVAAAGVAAKLYWRRLLSLLHIRKDPAEPDHED